MTEGRIPRHDPADYRATADQLSRLTPMQHKVTQNDGTEPPFRNEYHDNKAEGLYVDVASGTCSMTAHAIAAACATA